jgi:hypothetical protein
MALLDEMRARKLEELARAKFDPEISEAEIKVLQDSASSQDVDDPGEDAARPVVRAEFLRWLVTDAEAVAWLDPKGLRVVGATIPTELDLAECRECRCWFLPGVRFKGVFSFDPRKRRESTFSFLRWFMAWEPTG